MKQIVLYSLLTVMHFDTPEECQMWSNKIYGEGYRCFETYKYEELYLKPPPPRPNNFDEMIKNFLND
tara:strand:- start:767 stop:967 length:201 start_codon:yes stop_codon:yes gene_type:complete